MANVLLFFQNTEAVVANVYTKNTIIFCSCVVCNKYMFDSFTTVLLKEVLS